jgi:glucose/arabinose dehydrogenase
MRPAFVGLLRATFLLAGAALMLMSQLSHADEHVIDTKQGSIKVETVADGLDHPWGIAFLPDGRMLVTERPGRLRIVAKDGSKSEPLKGVPAVFAQGQGGLLDVALDPHFADNGFVYLSYSEPGEDGAGTAVARGKLGDGSIDNVEVIFRPAPKGLWRESFRVTARLCARREAIRHAWGALHLRDGAGPQQPLGQDRAHQSDGSVPGDNPFVEKKGAMPEIWSYGHRNPQGAAINPKTGKLWEAEFGPMGGDELNIPEAGRNYGWPVVSWGKHYDGRPIPPPPTHPEFADAIYHWNPVISPSGITFYTADAIPGWKGNLCSQGLSSEAIVRLTLDGDKVTGEERIPMGVRMRDVVQGPDGAIYGLTDESNGENSQASRWQRSAAENEPARTFAWLFGRFGRSAELRELDKALRSVDLHPNLVPEAVKLTTVRLLREHAHYGEPAPHSYRAAAEIIAYCMLGADAFAHAN